MLQQTDDLIGERHVTHGAARPQPGEGPVDHAEQHHGDGGLIGRLDAVGVGALEEARESGDHVALAVQDELALRFPQELGVGDQGDVAGGRVLVLGEKTPDQLVEGLPLVQAVALCPGLGLADQGQQALGVAVQEIEQDRFLALVLVIETRLAGATGRSDVVHAGGRKALARKTLGRDIDYRFAFEIVVGGTGAGHGLILPFREALNNPRDPG